MLDSRDALNLSHEPLANSQLSAEQKWRLTGLLDRYLLALENGHPIDPQAMIAAHLDLADPLREYLQRLDELHQAAVEFGGRDPGVPENSDLPDNFLRRLGDFVLGSEIGRGGMGIVYEAHQISLDRHVALKVLPFAAVLDSQRISRFRMEAQAAAQILHPNIVPVFAIGVDRGVHYYAMQLIDGQPLDRAIAESRERRRQRSRLLRVREEDVRVKHEWDASRPDQNDTLEFPTETTCGSLNSSHGRDTREYFRRVAGLGIQAAEALHAAHEHGVVHRDIKPSNLLLDRMGKLWVTDFGLARCRADGAGSMTGDIVGTMRYMSPEQAAGQNELIDHRTDVYSLGVTLYELCTLRPAVVGVDSLDLLRKIGVDEPPAPRKWNPEIPVSLEGIVLKAMARIRDERYPTARELAEDLQRFLEGRPIVARPPAMLERCLRWAIHRRRVVASVACIVLLALVGIGISAVLIAREKLQAERNYVRAEQNYRDAREAVDRFGAQFAQRLAGVPAARQVRQEMLHETLEYYQRFAEQSAGDPGLLADVAVTYSKIGTLTDEIGSTAHAIEAHEKAIALYQRLVIARPRDEQHRRHLALCHNDLALALRQAGRITEARRAHQKAIELQSELVDSAPQDQYLGDLAVSHSNLALLLAELGRRSAAEQSFREAIRLHEQLVQADPHDAQRRHDLAVDHNNLSSLFLETNREQAESCYHAALTHLRIAMDICPHNSDFATLLAATCNNLGSLQSREGRFSDAARSYQESIGLRQALSASDPSHLRHRSDLAVSYNNLGLVCCRLQQPEEAEEAFRQALAIQGSLAGLNSADIALRSSMGGVYNNLGIVLETTRRLDGAASAYRKAVEHQQYAQTRAPSVTRYRLFLNKHYFNLGRVYRQLGRAKDAIEIAMQRRELWPRDAEKLVSVAEELVLASELQQSEKSLALAIETLERAVAIGGPLPGSTADRAVFAGYSNDRRFSQLFAADKQ